MIYHFCVMLCGQTAILWNLTSKINKNKPGSQNINKKFQYQQTIKYNSVILCSHNSPDLVYYYNAGKQRGCLIDITKSIERSR
jgi:hypothetical protein